MEYVSLKEVVHIKHGYAFKGEFFTEENTGKIVLTPGNFSLSGGFIPTKKYTKEEGFPEEFILKANDLIVTMTDLSKEIDTIGFAALIPSDDKLYLHNQRIGLVTIISNDFDKDYIYWLMRTKCYQRTIANTSNGATVHHTSPDRIYKYKFKRISLPIQQKIASILSAYDRLIENNTRRIRLLEQMAENLYKEWFVRFRFPEHEKVEMVKSKYDRIPSNFNIIQMQDVFDYYVGGGWGQENMSDDFSEEANVIRGADFPKVCQYDISTCPRRFHKKSNYRSRQLEDGDIVMEISGGTSEQPVGRTILVTQSLIDRFDNGKVICASFCKLIRLRKNVISPFFFYYWMKFLYDTRIINRFQLQSTGIINFKFEPFLRKGDVMLPPTNVMNSFESHVVPIHKEMNKLAQQNQLLTRQRDLLLPRLMSGKLEVKS